MSMKDSPLGFNVVPHKARVFDHHLEVGPLPSNFTLPSIPGPFLMTDKKLKLSREVVVFFNC